MQPSSVFILPAAGSQNLEQKSTVIILPNFIPITNLTPIVNQKSVESSKQVKKERPIKPYIKPKPENETKIELNIPKPVKRRKSRLSTQSKLKKQKINPANIKQESLDTDININNTCTIDSLNKFNRANKTELSQKLFDSIEYLSTSWNSIYSTGNDTQPKLLDLFRQFHCADCLKSFQEQQQNRVKMNTPPPPLQPISEEATNGLYNYFGPSNQISNIRLNPYGINSSNNQDTYQLDLKETKISLDRKLAQRRPEKELVERGILPSLRLPMQHYDQWKILEKAQLQDILENKLEKRPNREILVQKNILPDSKAAPSLQSKCNELKRARLADDLNEKLAKRPGPLELVESGILVSSDSSLTEAIKGGKIIYPKTSLITNRHHPYSRPDYFNESNLNFNFGNMTDNEDSNASQNSNSTNLTNNTIVSLPSSSVGSFNLLNNNNNSNNMQINSDIFENNNSPTNYKNISSPFSSDLIDSPGKASNKSSSSGSRKIKSTNLVVQNVSNKANKKQTLIFHQYMGPNQKSSKTTLKAPNKPARINKSKSSSSSFMSEIATNNFNNEINSDNNSNDSNNANYDNQEEELNAYKILLEQQKVFLLFNNSPKQPEPVEPIETIENNVQENVTNFTSQNQPIQLVPIGDVKILQNLVNNGLVPIRTFSILNNSDSSNSTNQIVQIDSNIQSGQVFEPQVESYFKTETLTDNSNQINLEELSVIKLKEECQKRKISKTGPKQKLIERIKEHDKKDISKQGILSPDSGVYVDNSPSFASCEPSPIAGSKLEKKLEIKSNSLSDYLNIDITRDNKAEIENISNQLKLDMLKIENEKDLSQTALTLEQSLKNSAELLKQLSFAGQLDDLHKLEKQMQQSLEIVKKLKLASGVQETNTVQNNQQIRNGNSLRAVNSMPCNLRDLAPAESMIYDTDPYSKAIDKQNIPIFFRSNLIDANFKKVSSEFNVTSTTENHYNMNKQVIFTTNSVQESNNTQPYSSNSLVSSSAASTYQNNNNNEMDYNDTCILQLCDDLNYQNNFISSNQTNSNLNENFLFDLNNHNQPSFVSHHSRISDPLINANDGNTMWDFLDQVGF